MTLRASIGLIHMQPFQAERVFDLKSEIETLPQDMRM